MTKFLKPFSQLLLVCAVLSQLGATAKNSKKKMPKKGPLSLSLLQTKSSKPGEIHLQLSVKNNSAKSLSIDDGSLIRYLTFYRSPAEPADPKKVGEEIPQWPYRDILVAEPGKEVFWELKPGQVQEAEVIFWVKKGKWNGFGIPDSEYQGWAIDAHYGAGSAIHALPTVPTTVAVQMRWIADPQTVLSRTQRLGMGQKSVWSGELASNAVTVVLGKEHGKSIKP